MKPLYLVLAPALVAGAMAAGCALAETPAPPAPPAGPQWITRIDANADGFATRAEIVAEATRLFAELDTDKDGKLTAQDRPEHGERRVFIHRDETSRTAPRAPRGEKNGARGAAPKAGEHEEIEREIRIEHVERRGHHGGGPRPPHVMMMLSDTSEFDRNTDGGLDQSEFLAQQTRFFDAADGNGDGKIKFEPMSHHAPEPPAPPAPPGPPAPPALPR